MEELDKIKRDYKIKEFLMKGVERNYAFDQPGVLRGKQKFVKIKYSAKCIIFFFCDHVRSGIFGGTRLWK